MNSWIIFSLIFLNITIASAKTAPLVICLSGKIVKSLPSYGVSFENAAKMAIREQYLSRKVSIEKFYYDNRPLSPLVAYRKMIKRGCNAIIGFNYLSDLELITRQGVKHSIPIFSPYGSTEDQKTLASNIFLFRPPYSYLSSKMFDFLNIENQDEVLVVTEVNRSSMLEYKDAYLDILKKNKVKFQSIDILEKAENESEKVIKVINTRRFSHALLLTGTVSAAQIVNGSKRQNITFVGTENFGSSTSQSFFIRLKKKNISSFFIRNLSYLGLSKEITELTKFYDRYHKRFKIKPSLLSAYTYDATRIILQSYLTNGNSETKNIVKQNYSGITGVIINKNIYSRSNYSTILKITNQGYVYER